MAETEYSNEVSGVIPEKLKEVIAKDNAMAPKPTRSVSQQVSDLLMNYEANIIRALGTHDDASARKMIEVATLLIAQDKGLQECSHASLVAAVLEASAMDIDVSKQMGFVYFVPRWNKERGQKEVTVQLSYRGMIELVMRSGHVAAIEANIVYDGDSFSYALGTSSSITHTRGKYADRGKMCKVYSVATMMNGTKVFCVLTIEEIEEFRRRDGRIQGEEPSKVWATDYEAMSKAKAIRQLCKFLPRTTTTMYKLPIDYDKEENIIINTQTK